MLRTCCVGAIFLFAALSSRAAPQPYPVEMLNHLVDKPLSALKLTLGEPDRVKNNDPGTIAIWYGAAHGAWATGPIMAHEDCQFIFLVGADGKIESIDLSGDPGTCKDMIKRNKKAF